MNNYDFGDLLSILDQLRTNQDPDLLRQFTHELNMFFKGSVCASTLYTRNTDNVFFGLCVMPSINDADIYKIILDDPYAYSSSDNHVNTVTKYYVELDSKLFDPILDLTNEEILALIIHDIGALANSSSAIDIAKAEIDAYLDRTNATIRRADTINYATLLSFGFKDLLWKITSVMYKDHDMLLADDFTIACNLGMPLEFAIKKLDKYGNITYVNSGKKDTSTIIAWCLNVYNDILTNRIITIKGLKKSLSYTAIRLVKREIERVITALGRIDDNSLLELYNPFTALGDAYRGMSDRMKYNSVRDYENDLYEYQIRMKNADNENDALILLHSINTKLSIIDGVLVDKDLDPKLREKYSILYAKYSKLRDELSRKNVFKRDYNRIYVNYPS